MRHPVPLLMMLALAGVTAEKPDLDQALRVEESAQKGISGLTDNTARDLSGMIDDYRFNRIGVDDQLKTLHGYSGDLNKISGKGEDGEDSMSRIATRLAAARSGGGSALDEIRAAVTASARAVHRR